MNLQQPFSNRLLDALPEHEMLALQPYLQRVPIPAGAVLFNTHRPPRFVYLLTSGLACVLSQLNDGFGMEVGLIGREGIPGISSLLGRHAGRTRCVVQEAGAGFRMELARFEKAFWELPGLHRRVLQYVQHQSCSLEQLAVCNNVHSAEQRLSRWLLMASDRISRPSLTITHETLAQMLGLRRTTVTLVAGGLQKKGLIDRRRGRVQVVDREGLLRMSCECQAMTQIALDVLYAEREDRAPWTPEGGWNQQHTMHLADAAGSLMSA